MALLFQKKDRKKKQTNLTFILLCMTTPTFVNSVDPDQMASEELHCLSFSLWIWTKTYDVIWLADSQK